MGEHLNSGRKHSPEHIAKRVVSFLKTRNGWSDSKKLEFRKTARRNATRANLSEERRRAAQHRNAESRQRHTSKIVIIYGLFDPRDGSLRYVGKTAGRIQKRLTRHALAAKAGTATHLYNWWRLLGGLGLEPEIGEIDTVSPGDDWVESEQFWIAYFRFIGCALLNVCAGGQGTEGYSFTKEHRLKLSAAHTGRKFGAEHREKWRAAAKATWAKNPISRWKPEKLPEITATRAERRAAGLYKKRMPATEATKAKIRATKRARVETMTAKPLPV